LTGERRGDVRGGGEIEILPLFSGAVIAGMKRRGDGRVGTTNTRISPPNYRRGQRTRPGDRAGSRKSFEG